MRARRIVMVVTGIVLALGIPAMAQTTMETVPVANAGNLADTEVMNDGTTGYGSVAYTYAIGKCEVTNAQYTASLNAVAAVGDPNDLYHTQMGGAFGGISRSGSGTGGDPWVYAVQTNRGNRPVNYVSWYDALRFCNWLHNGKPMGAQDAGTTENGSYNMAQDFAAAASPVRNPGATWALPTEDEWYKAAYHKNDGVTGNYWDYPTASDTVPTAELPAGTDMVSGSANYYTGVYLDPTYGTTEVGAYTAKPSDSAYGTFDQGGNVFEWNEALVGTSRCLRGGAWNSYGWSLHANYRNPFSPTTADAMAGFRIGLVPEPTTVLLVALGSLAMIRRRR